MATITFVPPTTWNGQTIAPVVTAVSYMNMPTVVNVTGLTASTAYVFQVGDPNGGFQSTNFTSTVGGTYSQTVTPTGVGTLTINVLAATAYPAAGSGTPLSSSLPPQPSLPSFIIGSQVLAPVTFNMVTGS
jgi:hypothetical protein